MQLVVVIAVKNAVSAATITFTATSIILFFITNFGCIFCFSFNLTHEQEGKNIRFLFAKSKFYTTFAGDMHISNRQINIALALVAAGLLAVCVARDSHD